MENRHERSASVLLSLALLLTLVVPALADHTITVPVGTVIPLRMDTHLSSDSARVGDRFTATVFRPVVIDRRVIIPEGAKVEGRVTGADRAQRGSKAGTIAIGFDRLVYPNGFSTPIDGTLTTLDEQARRQLESSDIDNEDRVEGTGRTRRAVVFIGGGAGAGAIIGAVAGGAKGAAVGAGLGAVLGTIGVLVSKGDSAEVKPGTEFGLTVERSFTIGTESVGVAGVRYPYDGSDQYPPLGAVSHTGSHSQTQTILTSPEAIRAAQTALRDRGLYNGPINGVLNNATRTALRDFQRTRNISMSGELDTRTAQELGINTPDDDTGAAGTVFTSPESIRSAQMVLRDRGLYTGPVNGVMTGATRAAVRQFQRDRNINQSGELDLSTAQALGIANERGNDAVLVDITNPRAERAGRDSIRITLDAQTRSGGWQVYTDEFVSGNTLHVYVRGVPSSGPGTQALSRHPISEVIDNAGGVTRVTFHGAQRDVTVDVLGSGGGIGSGTGTGGGIGTGSGGIGNARQIAFLAERLMTSYSRELNVRTTRGQVAFDTRRDLREAEVEVLFHLYSLQAAANLYSQMTSAITDPGALKGAADSLVRQARLVNRVLRRQGGGVTLPPLVNTDWEQFKAELSRISLTNGDLDADPDRIR